MAEWSKAPESGSLVSNLVRKGEGSNPSVVTMRLNTFFSHKRRGFESANDSKCNFTFDIAATWACWIDVYTIYCADTNHVFL